MYYLAIIGAGILLFAPRTGSWKTARRGAWWAIGIAAALFVALFALARTTPAGTIWPGVAPSPAPGGQLLA